MESIMEAWMDGHLAARMSKSKEATVRIKMGKSF